MSENVRLRVGFTGSRNYPQPVLVGNFVGVLALKYPDVVVISGGRGAVDRAAEVAAVNNRLNVISFRPRMDGIDVYESLDGAELRLRSQMLAHNDFTLNCFFRNGLIAEAARVVGFWDMKSRGTADTLSKAKGKGRPRTVYGPDGRQLTEEEVDRIVHEVLT